MFSSTMRNGLTLTKTNTYKQFIHHNPPGALSIVFRFKIPIPFYKYQYIFEAN